MIQMSWNLERFGLVWVSGGFRFSRVDKPHSSPVRDVSLIPSVWLDTDVCSGFDVYSLGLEVIRRK